jgi:hypothetical protein
MVIVSRFTWVAHVERVEKVKMHTKFWSENLNGIDKLEDLDVDAKKAFKWVFKK